METKWVAKEKGPSEWCAQTVQRRATVREENKSECISNEGYLQVGQAIYALAGGQQGRRRLPALDGLDMDQAL